MENCAKLRMMGMSAWDERTLLPTRKWFPLQGELAPLQNMLYFINNKPILIHFMLAAGIVQDTFVGEAVEGEGGEEDTTAGYFYCYFYWYFYRQARKSPVS